MFKTNRRAFMLGSASLGLASTLPVNAFAQDMRSVTTKYGTYDIPVAPKRVVAIDSRLDLQPALALGLPVIGYGHSVPGPWVPVSDEMTFFGGEVNIEQVLAADPDLVICADYDPDSTWWPANRLRTIAPVVTTNSALGWKDAFREFATLMDMAGAADAAIGEYETLIADIRTRRADLIASKSLVSVQPGEGVFFLMNGTMNLQTQVLADLGAKTIPPLPDQKYNSEEVPAEAFVDTLGQMDGLLLVTSKPDDVNGLKDEPLWQRLPAVERDAMILSNGNINYGSIYSAIQIAKFVDELYGKMA